MKWIHRQNKYHLVSFSNDRWRHWFNFYRRFSIRLVSFIDFCAENLLIFKIKVYLKIQHHLLIFGRMISTCFHKSISESNQTQNTVPKVQMFVHIHISPRSNILLLNLKLSLKESGSFH